MNNYKISSDISDNIKNVYEETLMLKRVDDLVQKINKLKDFYCFNGVVEFACPEGKYIKIANRGAFVPEEIAKYIEADHDFAIKLDVVRFKLNALNLQRKKAIMDYDIALSVKLADKIAKEQMKMSVIESEIALVNNDIVEIENDFKTKMEQLSEELADVESKSFSWDKFSNKYGNLVVEKYRAEKFINELHTVLGACDKDTIDMLAAHADLDSNMISLIESYRAK
ncbi:MAG: hypothetical protein E7356_00830 [Clostridiales bacterium]|nr:hypothetical protein [Clostridiales bacterium]